MHVRIVGCVLAAGKTASKMRFYRGTLTVAESLLRWPQSPVEAHYPKSRHSACNLINFLLTPSKS